MDFATLHAEKADILHLQNREELRWLWDRFHAATVGRHSAYLEIGARRGGSFWMLTQAMPVGSMAIAIDMPGARWGDMASDRYLLEVCDELRQRGYYTEPLLLNSHHVSTALALERVAVMPEFNLIMVDGDHTREGVVLDFEMYRRYLAPGGMMAFHDIWVPDFGVRDAWHYPIARWTQKNGWGMDVTPDLGLPRLGFGVVTRPA